MQRLMILIMVGCIIQAGLSTDAPAEMEGLSMELSVNGGAHPPPLPATSSVAVAVSVNPGPYYGIMADWWIAAQGPQGWYCLVPEGWRQMHDCADLQPVCRMPLSYLPATVIFSGGALPSGRYTFYFGLGEPGASPARIVTLTFDVVPVSAWTVLCYMDADNNLEPDFLAKFLDLARSGSSHDVVLLAQLDRGGYSTNFGGWTGCERFVITNGMRPDPAAAVTDWGDGHGGREVNMAEPEVLSAFLQWGMENYPARHYILIMGNHGFGWRGLCVDGSHDSQTLFLADLGTALSEAPRPVDILLLDCCLMQTFETLYDLAQAGAAYALGSQNYSQSDWPYREMLSGLLANPDWTPAAAARDIHRRLAGHYAAVPGITLALSDLEHIPVLASNLLALADAMLQPALPFSFLQARAQSVMEAIDRTVIAEYHGAAWTGRAHGLSIYFPEREFDLVWHAPDAFYFYTAEICSWAGTLWHDFLDLYFTGQEDIHGRHIRFDIIDIHQQISVFFDQQQEQIDLYDFCARVSNTE